MSFTLLGILQSQAAGGGVASDMELISTTILDSTQSSITFSGLNAYAGVYNDLTLVMNAAGGANTNTIQMQFNNNTSENIYQYSFLFLNGSTPNGSNEDQDRTQFDLRYSIARMPDADPKDYFAYSWLTFPNFRNSTEGIKMQGWSASRSYTTNLNFGKQHNIHDAFFEKAQALSTIKLTVDGGQLFQANTRFSLYGWKVSA